MSLNSAVGYKKEFFTERLENVLKSIINTNKSNYEEQKLLLEELLNEATKDLTLFFSLEEISIRDRIYYEQLITNINNCYTYCYVLNNLLKDLNIENDKVESFESAKITNLQNKLNRIKQKIASINLFTGDIKFVLNESFNTTENIKSLSDISISNGFLTLPISSMEEISFQSYSIGPNSIGTLGSSDSKSPANSNLLEVSQEAIFQWEELDNDTAILELELFLESKKIINGISVSFYPIDIVQNCELTSIKGIENNNLIELLDEVIFINYDTNIIPIYPTYTNKIILTFKQTNSYSLNLYKNETISRKVISLDELKLYQISYKAEGAAESLKLSVKNNPNACQASLDIRSTNNALSTISGLFSIDENTSYKSFDMVGSYSNINSLYWKLLIKRNSEAFSSNSSVVQSDNNYDYYSQLDYVSGLKSPIFLSLKKKPLNDSIVVIEPKVLRRGNGLFDLQIGEGIGSKMKIQMPIEMSPKLAQECVLKVNGKIWPYSENILSETGTAEVWSLDKTTYDAVNFGDNVTGASPPDKSKITFSLPFESLFFESTEDSYLTKFDYLFDPDLNNIDIFYVAESKASGKQILPRNEKIIKLLYKNIVEESVVFSERSIDGSSYGSPIAITEIDFNDGNYSLSAGQYTIDYKKGYIYFYSEIPLDNIITVSFSYYPTKVLDKKHLSIIYNAAIPEGVSISKESLPTSSIVDTLGDSLSKLKIDGEEDLSPLITANVNSKTFVFTRNGIIKGTVNTSELFSDSTIPQEVDFIDGYTEFLGLIKVDTEKTIAFNGVATVISFVISGGNNFYEPLGISFEDLTYFETQVSGIPTVPGEWSVDLNGTVSVYISNGLPAGIKYSYYYSDSSFSSINKYSLDYKNSVLYTISNFKSGGFVSYLCGNYYAKYDLALMVNNFSYNKNDSIIEINTENQFSFTKLVKLIYPISIGEVSLKEIEPFYSPIIKSITFRFA